MDVTPPLDSPQAGGASAPFAWTWLLLPVAAAAAMACFPVYAGDVWMHLASARQILAEGRVQTYDAFLYTVPPETRYINQSWGAQLALYAFHAVGGVPALVALRMLLAAGAAGLFALLAIRRGARPWIAALVSASMVGVVATYYICRPLMFAPVCAAGMLLCLRRADWRWIAGALGIQLLWANLHASFVLGPVIAGAVALETTLAARVPAFRGPDGFPPERKAVVRGWVAAALAPVVALLNPNGVDLYLYVWRLRQLEWVHRTIREWMPPDWSKTANGWFLAGLVIAWAAIAAAAVRRRRIALAETMLAGVFTVQLFGSRRFILLAGLFLIAPVAAAVESLMPQRRRTRILVTLCMALLGLSVFVAGPLGTRLALGTSDFDLNRRVVPVRAVAFLEDHGVTGNVACAPYAGGYILWQLYPEARPSTDGRCLVNDPETIKAFNALANNRPGWERSLPGPEESDVLLIENSYRTPIHTIRDEWAVVYWDEYWEIWMRRGGRFADIVEARDLTLSAPNVLPFVYNGITDEERAAQEAQLRRKIEAEPNCGVAHSLLGYVLYGQAVKKLEAAYEKIRLARKALEAEAPDEAKELTREAARLERKAQELLVRSTALYEVDVALEPRQSRSLYGIGRNALWLLQYDMAAAHFEAAARIDPLVWVQAKSSAELAASYVDAQYGSKSPDGRSIAGLLYWLQVNGYRNRDAIRDVYGRMERPDEMPGWLNAPPREP